METSILEELLRQLPTLGVGGILALYIYTSSKRREDMFVELWQKYSETLVTVLVDNTESNKRLISLIGTAERNTFRKSDLLSLLEELRHKDSGKVKIAT